MYLGIDLGTSALKAVLLADDGHIVAQQSAPLDVSRPQDTDAWRNCHLLFIAAAETRRSAGGLGVIKALPVLTVSDYKGFADTDGLIELYVEGGRMRFAINLAAVERSGLRLSSRLLGLARIIRNDHVH